MPIIDFSCAHCGPFEHYRSVHSTDCPPCPLCGGPSSRHWLASTVRAQPDPVIVYRAPDGGFRFPGASTSLMTAHYDSLGYQRVEVRGAHEMRKLERQVNQHDYSRECARVEREQQLREQGESVRRSDLRAKMQSMSEFGKAVARAAMSKHDEEPRTYAKDPGFHSEVYSYDRGNRVESRDERGRRGRD